MPDGFAQPISAGGLIRRNRRQNDLPQALARAANGIARFSASGVCTLGCPSC
jgi:hypothetical protein